MDIASYCISINQSNLKRRKREPHVRAPLPGRTEVQLRLRVTEHINKMSILYCIYIFIVLTSLIRRNMCDIKETCVND